MIVAPPPATFVLVNVQVTLSAAASAIGAPLSYVATVPNGPSTHEAVWIQPAGTASVMA